LVSIPRYGMKIKNIFWRKAIRFTLAPITRASFAEYLNCFWNWSKNIISTQRRHMAEKLTKQDLEGPDAFQNTVELVKDYFLKTKSVFYPL
jgi:hypothetical protein